MRINKEYNVEEIIKEVERCIEDARQKNIGINISIDVLTVQAIVDILKTIPENDGEWNEAKCYGKYDEDDMACIMCEFGKDCRKCTESGNLEKAGCFGNYNEDEYELCEMCELLEDCQEATKNGNLEKPHCFGEYTNNCELLYKKTPCEYIDACRVEKEGRKGAENE